MISNDNSEMEVKQAVNDWFNAYSNRDVDSAMALVDKDEALLFLGVSEKHITPSELREILQKEFGKNGDISIQIPWMEIKMYNNLALVTLEAVFIIKIDELGMQSSAWQTMALKHRNGKWLIVQSHISFPDIDMAATDKSSPVQHLTFKDPITGLYNRLFFELEMERLDTKRQLPLSIIIGDVNALKMVNDIFGHQEGDRLLRHIAKIMRDSCRKEDIIARWGGDELVILLPKTSAVMANQICKRIEEGCKTSSFGLFKPSISIGYASKERERRRFKEVFKEAEDMMYRNKLIEGKNVRRYLISLLKDHLSRETHETEDHCIRLKDTIEKMGVKLDFSLLELNALSTLAILHDVGQIGVSDSILVKPDILTESEWLMIKRHPEIGYRIAMSAPDYALVADSILCHHEHWDGSGYPQGISGEEIPLMARLFALADAFDAMTNDRPYRKAMSVEDALKEITRCTGSQFDPKLAELFSNTCCDLINASKKSISTF